MFAYRYLRDCNEREEVRCFEKLDDHKAMELTVGVMFSLVTALLVLKWGVASNIDKALIVVATLTASFAVYLVWALWCVGLQRPEFRRNLKLEIQQRNGG